MSFIAMTKQELQERGVIAPDFVFVSGDAYVDHPSFGAAIICRFLESKGFSVGIIAQPQSDKDYKEFGEPAIAFMIGSGVCDSMVNNYTAAKKRRSDDVYSPGGKGGKRPDRALTVYSQKLKKLFPDSFVIVGGLEASLRRFAHYDYWADKVLPGVLVDSGADLLIYGMGEQPLTDLSEKLRKGIPIHKIKDLRGSCYLTAGAFPPGTPPIGATGGRPQNLITVPSYEEVKSDKAKYLAAFRIQNANAGGIAQEQSNGVFLIQNPPAVPLSQKQMDEIYALPFERAWHPSYDAEGGVPSIEEVKFSVTSHRGCYGACNFCALAFHQGTAVQNRSEESILAEVEALTHDKDFKGYIHDIGGPTANFYQPSCQKQCAGKNCIGHKGPCKNLKTDHSAYLEILRKARKIPRVKKVFVRSGVRFDYVLADKNPEFLNELVRHHISGQLKVAPEHIDDKVLEYMNKAPSKIYLEFYDKFRQANEKAGKKQYLVPYFISSHPGCTLRDAVKLSEYLHKIKYNPEQVQDFYPTPSTVSTTMFYCETDMSGKKIYVAKSPEAKKMQRALLQYKKKENYQIVFKALKEAGREDLIGYDKKCLVKPPERVYNKNRKGKK